MKYSFVPFVLAFVLALAPIFQRTIQRQRSPQEQPQELPYAQVTPSSNEYGVNADSAYGSRKKPTTIVRQQSFDKSRSNVIKSENDDSSTGKRKTGNVAKRRR